MKTFQLATVIILAQVSLVSAVPHVNHARFHRLQRDTPAQYTETVTVTDYSAIVWVDNKGHLISTEFQLHPATVAPAASASTEVLKPESPTSKVAAVPNSPSSSVQSAGSQAPPSATASIQAKVDNTSNKGSQPNNMGSGMGICYDMIDSSKNCKTSSTINSEFSFLKSQGYGKIRVYDIGCPLSDFVSAAANQGLKLMVGLNLYDVGNLKDLSPMTAELQKLIKSIGGNWAPVDTVYIGNELVNKGVAAAIDVAGAVTSAKQTLNSVGYQGNVVTVDTFNTMQGNPTLCSTSSYCAINTHAFFDPNTSADNAGNFVKNAFNAVQNANPGKQIVITESGWPYKGVPNGAANPGISEQAAAVRSIANAFSDQPGNLFLFQAYNAGYKDSGAFNAEPFWGIYDSDHFPAGN